jgi:hypothetical protein
MMVMGWADDDIYKAKETPIGGGLLRLRVPAGPLSIIESINNAGQNYLFWRAELSAAAPLDLDGPFRVFHN